MVDWLAFCEARIAMIAIVKSQGHHISWRQPETLGDPGSNFGLDLPTYPTCKQGLKGQKFSINIRMYYNIHIYIHHLSPCIYNKCIYFMPPYRYV